MILTYEREHNLPKLHDELLAAGIVPRFVEGKDDLVRLTVEDDADDDAVAAIVARHDPTPVPARDRWREAIEGAKTLAELKAALLANR